MGQALVSSMILATRASLMLRCTMRREPALQFSPMFQNAELTACGATASMSASASTTWGFLPPNSRMMRLRLESAE